MPSIVEDILGLDTSSLGKEELLYVKQRMIDKIVDLFFDGDVCDDLCEKVLLWLIDEADSDMKNAALLRKFNIIFEEQFQEEPVPLS